MSEFGDLVAQLRMARGLSQDDLARLAGIDRNSVGRVEQGRGGAWHRRTSRTVFECLGRAGKFTPEQAATYLDLAGLEQALATREFVLSPIERDIVLEDAGEPVSTSSTSQDMRQVHRALTRLIEALGPDKAATVLGALADATAPPAAHPLPSVPSLPSLPSRPPPPQPRELTVVSPPRVPFPGAVEQTRRTYAVKPPEAQPSRKAKPKARKRG